MRKEEEVVAVVKIGPRRVPVYLLPGYNDGIQASIHHQLDQMCVFVSDYALRNLSMPQIKALVAHEVGHFVARAEGVDVGDSSEAVRGDDEEYRNEWLEIFADLYAAKNVGPKHVLAVLRMIQDDPMVDDFDGEIDRRIEAVEFYSSKLSSMARSSASR